MSTPLRISRDRGQPSEQAMADGAHEMKLATYE
jgi:hypothetical protein